MFSKEETQKPNGRGIEKKEKENFFRVGSHENVNLKGE